MHQYGYVLTQIAGEPLHDYLKRRIFDPIGIARSTLHRWLHQIQDETAASMPATKTSREIASLVWETTQANLSWGRIQVANQMKLLGIVLSAFTVRNICRGRNLETPL
jgi:CubicO group peptidase (beta-lactamase class C family)